jgi:tetratricopeptide (TPR) repeat protein
VKKQTRLTYILLLLTVLAAFFLRVYKLGSDASFMTDEVTTVINSMQEVVKIPKLETRTPLQALWIAFGARVLGLGYSEFAVYFLSVIVSLVAVIVVYLLGNLLFDHRIGLLCAFILAFSAYDIYWSRSARYYALMVLLSSAAFLCLYKALVTNQKRAWLLYALFRTLSLYDHLTALWVFAGEGIFALGYISLPWIRKVWERRHEIRLGQKRKFWPLTRESIRQITTSRLLWFTISITLILLAYIPVWYFTLRDIYLGISVLRVGALSSELLAPREVRTGQLQPMLGGGWQGPLLILNKLTGWITPLHVIFLILFTMGALFCVQKRQWTQLLFILTITITPMVMSTWIKSYSIVIDGRYLISLLPLYNMMVARGIDGFGHRIAIVPKLRRNFNAYVPMATTVVLAIVIAGLNLTKIPLTFRTTGQDWHAVSHFLAQNAKPDDLIVVDGTSPHFKALQFYLPEHRVVQNDPRIAYETLYQKEEGFWLVFQSGTDMYTGLRYWTNNVKAASIVFASGWYPDIDQNTDLAPAQNWDLYVVYASRTIKPAEQVLKLTETWLAEAEAVNPGDVRWHFTMAEAYQRFNRCDEAVNEYNLALREGYINDQLASYIYDARGRCWKRLGKTDLAIADWQQAIAHADWNKEPYIQLNATYTDLGRLDEAQALFQAARKTNPKEAWPLVLRGDFYRQRGLTEQAMVEYKQAIDLQPWDRTAYQHLAEVYLGGGELGRVVLLYQKAMQLNPVFGWSEFQLGQFYQSKGKVVEALDEYQKAVALSPEYAPGISDFMVNARWDLATAINSIHAYSDKGDLLRWLDNSWARPYPNPIEVVVGRSTLMVGSHAQPNQLLFHPYSNKENTYIEFKIPQIYFTQLKVGYGMADKTSGLSNGVEYRIDVRRQGKEEYEPLLKLLVDKNIWEERTVSLLPYWGEDLEFRLSVNARGDAAYDWLQTTVELLPPPQPAWDLSSNLRTAQFTPVGQPMTWREDAFFTPDGSLLVGYSKQPVEGRSMPGQVILKPFSSNAASTLTFSLSNYYYRILKTWFGLADEALPLSNGVDYTVSVSVDGGQSFVDLVQSTVTTSTWRSVLVELPQSRNLLLKLSTSARGDFGNDWLQVRLDLLPYEDEWVNQMRNSVRRK